MNKREYETYMGRMADELFPESNHPTHQDYVIANLERNQWLRDHATPTPLAKRCRKRIAVSVVAAITAIFSRFRARSAGLQRVSRAER